MGKSDTSTDIRVWAPPRKVTQSGGRDRVRDPEQPRAVSFADEFPCGKNDEQKLKREFHLY